MLNNLLFARLALVFLVILGLTAGVVTWISFDTAQKYFDEANQKLNKDLAQFTNDHLETFTDKDSLNEAAIDDIMHSMMVINPDVEVYLLNPKGDIISHVAPYKTVVREKINVAPIQEFIETEGSYCIKGDDPRDAKGKKIFSAAPVMKGDQLMGYYYIILASQKRTGVLAELTGTYALGVGLRLILVVILGAIVLGMFALWYQLRHLIPITEGMQEFQKGNYSVRISSKTGIFNTVSNTFNTMASQIEQQIEKIRSVDQFRKELIANISHDLRTPLSIIMGYVETLQMKGDQLSWEQQDKYFNNIAESSKRLNGLVKQLFELSNLENNQIEFHAEPFALNELVHDMMGQYEVLAETKNIELKFVQRDGLPLAEGDISQVERVIQNLLDNALKFTPEGGLIELAIQQEDKQLKFRITDTGVGIPEEQLSAVFDRYTTDSGSKKGTGLGLAIAHKIMELHNSKLSVSSKVNEGTTFSFVLPVYSL